MMLLKLRTSRCCLRDKDERVPTTGEMKFEVKLYLFDIIVYF